MAASPVSGADGEGIIADMSMQEIQAAITELPENELESLMTWIEEYREAAWNRQIAQDVDAGRFDALRERVRQQRQAGQ